MSVWREILSVLLPVAGVAALAWVMFRVSPFSVVLTRGAIEVRLLRAIPLARYPFREIRQIRICTGWDALLNGRLFFSIWWKSGSTSRVVILGRVGKAPVLFSVPDPDAFVAELRSRCGPELAE